MFPCSHTFSYTHFPHIFVFSTHFRTVIFRILFPCSQKLANVPLFPSIFCQCSLVPQNPWETLRAGRSAYFLTGIVHFLLYVGCRLLLWRVLCLPHQEHRLTNLLFLLLSSFFSPFVPCCFTSTPSKNQQVWHSLSSRLKEEALNRKLRIYVISEKKWWGSPKMPKTFPWKFPFHLIFSL